MLHLSLLQLPRSAGRWRFLQSYELHQLLWKGFPGIARNESENRFLYRHEENDTLHSVLVQSATSPNWSSLEDEAEGTTAQIKEFDPTGIPNGTQLRFMIRANPVTKRKYADGKARHIVIGSDRHRLAELMGVELKDLPSRDDLLVEWLQRKGAEGGFVLEQCVPGPNHDLVVGKPKQTEHATFTGVDFSGILRITDPNAFANTLRHGIGRGRAFGFGLLSVKRIT